MPQIIKLAKTASEIDDVLSVRYQCLREKGHLASPIFELSKRLIDHFDVFPTTLHLCVYSEGKINGTIRAFEYLSDESYVNRSHDYSESFKNLQSRCFFIDMIAFLNSMEYQKTVMNHSLSMICNILSFNHIKFAFCNLPTDLLIDLDLISFKPVGTSFFCSELGLEITPILIDLQEGFNASLSKIIDKEIIRFQEAFYKIIFAPGEVLITQGEKGSTSYLLESGEVEVLVKGRTSEELIPINKIGPGKLVGEIAMVTNQPRTASIMATTVTPCLAFNRTDFMSLMFDDPHKSIDIFKIFSKRLQTANQKIAELSRGASA